MSVFRKVSKKYKRKPVDWYAFLLDHSTDEIYASFLVFRKEHKGMSWNRCAWNVLKKYYSTTALAYFRQFGRLPGEEVFHVL